MRFVFYYFRVFLIIFIMTVSVSCGKDTIKDIGSIPVSDAAYIFTRSQTRSSGDDDQAGTWKVDFSGNELKLKVLDRKGEETDIEIYSVSQFSEKYLVVSTSAGNVFVDVATNKAYRCPNDISTEDRVEEYSPGLIYYVYGWTIKRLRINSESLITEEFIPEGQDPTDFFLGNNNSIYFNHGSCYEGGGKIMTESRRLYPIDIECMMFGSADRGIYSVEPGNDEDADGICSGSIYRWTPVSDDEMRRDYICDIPEFPENHFAPVNTFSNNVILFAGHSIYEFDGTSCILKKSYVTEEDKAALDKLLSNLGYLWGYGYLYRTISGTDVFFDHNPGGSNEDTAIRLDTSNYDIESIHYEIPEDEYEIYSTQTDASWGKLLFTALRYSDSSIVLGEVDEQGNVTILNQRPSQYHITEYFALN